MPKTENTAERLERILAAIRTVNELHDLGDATYDVREQRGGNDVGGQPFTGNSWEHPDVKRYSDAVTVLREEGAL
jgi:hypothetical protein